ncbi:hypothetical protein JMA_33290 [Jeotgalibacillus malaysiensis]|uniref:Uncharacterized protein n=1 Tax=Jeotgalibacillus malaysiensis TaxID=1508404 RepID=A0A0B5ARD3_9BACL|nr:hypothetical protein JMA_33290 [Jeotgalibacillus malaysiensis]
MQPVKAVFSVTFSDFPVTIIIFSITFTSFPVTFLYHQA